MLAPPEGGELPRAMRTVEVLNCVDATSLGRARIAWIAPAATLSLGDRRAGVADYRDPPVTGTGARRWPPVMPEIGSASTDVTSLEFGCRGWRWARLGAF